ncbi:MAG: hypothetical protein ABR555_11145 [Pyrinomonadaceae bacterium]
MSTSSHDGEYASVWPPSVGLATIPRSVKEQMIEDQADGLLNANQQRALSTRLAMLDRFFYDVEQLLSGDAPKGEMFEVINALTEEQKESVLSLLNEGRREIRGCRDQFKLEVKREDLHRVMAGHLGIFWTILEDSRARKLEGFGGISPGLAAELDPKVDNLVRIVNSLRSVLIE